MIAREPRRIPYTFWWNEKRYTVDADTFAKLSKKFPEIRSNPETENQMVLTNVMSEETFKAFLSACQFEHFDINKTNVFDLLKLAQEWEVPSLIEYCNTYIAASQAEQKKPDYLGILIEHVETDTDTKSDWAAVAFDINRALRDKRFMTLPPEVIYQILAIADRKYLDQTIFKEFVLELFKENPKNAVPLMLRLDFSILTQDERDFIFKNKFVHHMNINYFIASSLSAITNKTELQLENEQIRQAIDLDVIRVKNDIRALEISEQINKPYKVQLDEIYNEIDNQKKQLEDLSANFDVHNRRMQITERKISSCRTPCDRTVLDQIQTHSREFIDTTTTEVNKQLEKHFEEMEKFYQTVGQQTDAYLKEQTLSSDNPIFKAQLQLKDLCEQNRQTAEAIKKMKDQMADVKSLLCAKVVRDKLRYDEFLRRHTGRKYKIFDTEPQIWNLTPLQVEDADARLRKMEHQLDEYCPLRQANSPTK